MYTRLRHTDDRGFTLIELLVVIAIIGILSSVVLASLNGARTRGRDARRLSDIKQLQAALELSYGSTGYPALASLAPNFIASLPKDPSTGADYVYVRLTQANATCSSGVCPKYVLAATLEQTDHAALVTDIDTASIGGISCTDPVYCVQP